MSFYREMYNLEEPELSRALPEKTWPRRYLYRSNRLWKDVLSVWLSNQTDFLVGRGNIFYLSSTVLDAQQRLGERYLG